MNPWQVSVNHGWEYADVPDVEEAIRLAAWLLLSGNARVVAIVRPDGSTYPFDLADAVKVPSEMDRRS